VLFVGLGLAVGGFEPLTAHAHAFPERSVPRVGSKIKATPEAVQIWFDGYLEPVFSQMKVYDESGRRMDKGRSRVDPSDSVLLEVGLPPLLPGRYRVMWNVVAIDGHRTEGDYWFTIEAPP
jgi:copper resistance protein C